MSKKIFQRGQVMVMSALLLIPLSIAFIGGVMDLGWYYLNVSRLQNAADAAVVAGAQKLVTMEDFSGYSYDGSIVSIKEIESANPSNKNFEEGNNTAKQYVASNIGDKKTVQKLNEENEPCDAEIITDKWSKGGNPEVETEFYLYEEDDTFYYVIILKEKVQHFFLSGLLDDMKASVVSVAMLTKSNASNDPVLTPEEKEALEKVLNKNVIIGNWEVQNTYRQQDTTIYETDENGNYVYDKNGNKKTVYLKDAEGKYMRDENGSKIKAVAFKYGYGESSDYYARFGRDQYAERWNHFQDLCNHYYPEDRGDHIRRETIVIQDDVTGSGESARYGENSNVSATKASINYDRSGDAYNPAVTTPKTYHPYYENISYNTTAEAGLPYTWDRLDSINVDFVPEVMFNEGSEFLYKNWDCCPVGDILTSDNIYSSASPQNAKNNYPTPPEINVSDRKYLRIHHSIRFEAPYKVRAVEKRNSENKEGQDVLWGRIESEPMLPSPDARNGLSGKAYTRSFNSVRQIIINFNQSNCDEDNDRPVILFYEGPEKHEGAGTNESLRDSKPVIVNFKVPFRAILYMPNSPVVVTGEHQNDFKGFIVAKKYMRLKTASDFVFFKRRYYKKRDYEHRKAGDERFKFEDNPLEVYFAEKKDGSGKRFYFDRREDSTGVYYLKRGSNERFDNPDYDYYFEDVYHAVGDDETEYYKVIDSVHSDGIEMFTDEYGNVAYEDLTSQPTKCGNYDNFGRSDFVTHNFYWSPKAQRNNLLRSK